jgi:predicted PurR-regulated permease PerM
VTRFVSLAVLVAILLVVAILFFRVMAEFLLPMFLAAILLITFRPLHRWCLTKCGGRQHLAAGLTTLTILVVFLVPLCIVLLEAAAEGLSVYQSLKKSSVDMHSLAQSVADLAARVGLPLDPADLESNLSAGIQAWLAPVALSTTQFLGSLLLGLVVMIVSLYFFFADGPVMSDTMVDLLPLDKRYQRELIDEFANISRALVVAMLITALAQGLLAGLGFYFAGLPSLFLLVLLTMLMSMVPFVGAAGVWAPAALWLYFHDQRHVAAVILALYGAGIVSTIDSVIKPIVLRGRSNLHPLLGLLSALGGVKALGPIGIFVGPMVVALLQAVLKMVQHELAVIDRRATPASPVADEEHTLPPTA